MVHCAEDRDRPHRRYEFQTPSERGNGSLTHRTQVTSRQSCFKPLQSGAMVHCAGRCFIRKVWVQVSNPFRAGQWFTVRGIQSAYPQRSSFKPLQSGAMVHCMIANQDPQEVIKFQTPSERGNGSLFRRCARCTFSRHVSNPFRAGQWFTAKIY